MDIVSDKVRAWLANSWLAADVSSAIEADSSTTPEIDSMVEFTWFKKSDSSVHAVDTLSTKLLIAEVSSTTWRRTEAVSLASFSPIFTASKLFVA